MEFQERLKELRIKKKLTQQELADLINVNRMTYVNYETGKNEPKFRTLLELSKIFNVTTDYLLGITDDNVNENTQKEKIEQKYLEFEEATNLYKISLDRFVYSLIQMVEYNHVDAKEIGETLKNVISIQKRKGIDIETFVVRMINQWSTFENDKQILLMFVTGDNLGTNHKK